jgi:hypothetical protein
MYCHTKVVFVSAAAAAAVTTTTTDDDDDDDDDTDYRVHTDRSYMKLKRFRRIKNSVNRRIYT